MQQNPENEASLFKVMTARLGPKFSSDGKDISSELALARVTAGPVRINSVCVLRDGKEGVENWTFREMPNVESFTDGLSDLTKEDVKDLATNLELDEELIFKAALLTRTLIDDHNDELAVILNRGPEVLRLVHTTLSERNSSGLFLPRRQGFALECYLPVRWIRSIGFAIPVMQIHAHTEHQDISFPEIFRPVVLFSATVAWGHELMKAQAEAREAEGGEPALTAQNQ